MNDDLPLICHVVQRKLDAGEVVINMSGGVHSLVTGFTADGDNVQMITMRRDGLKQVLCFSEQLDNAYLMKHKDKGWRLWLP